MYVLLSFHLPRQHMDSINADMPSASVWLVNTIQTSLFIPLTLALPWAPRQRSRLPSPCPRLPVLPQSRPFVVSLRDPRCYTEEAGCSRCRGQSLHCCQPLRAHARVGTKGLSCPSLGKGPRSSWSEVQSPAAVI